MHAFPSSPPFRLCLVSSVTAAVETGLWKTTLLRSGSEFERTLGNLPGGLSNFFLLGKTTFI